MGVLTKPITYEDSLNMPETEFPEEIVTGEVVALPPPKISHQSIIGNLAFELRKQLDPAEYLVLESYGQAIRQSPRFTYRLPDLAVFRKTRIVSRDEYYIWSAPELLVEVLSASNTRRGSLQDLLADYAEIAVPEIWLADSVHRHIRVLRYEQGRYVELEAAISEGQLRPQNLPAVEISVDRLWL